MKKTIFIAVILLVLFSLAFGLIYLNNVYLPTKIKARVAKSLSDALGYNLEIGKLSYNPIQGVILNDIVVYDKVKDKQNTILTVKQIDFHILFLPLLRERKIIIPLMHVASPYFYVRYQKDGSFNFSRAISARPAKGPKPRVKLSFLVYKVNIFNGSGLFEDEHATPVFSKAIPEFSLGLTLKPFTKISFLAQAKILHEKQAVTKLYCRGEYDFASKELISDVSVGNFIIPQFGYYLSSLPFSIPNGTLDNANFDLEFKGGLLKVSGKLNAQGLMLRKEDLAFSGDALISPEIEYDLNKKAVKYQANLELSQASLSGAPYLKNISNVNGTLGLTNDKAWTNGLKFQAIDADFTLKGTLEKFTSPSLDITLDSGQLALEKLLVLLPQKPEGLNLTGLSNLTLHLKGSPLKSNFEAAGVMQLKNAKLENRMLKEPLSNISGRLDFDLNSLRWSDFNFRYQDVSYTSSGKAVNFSAPDIEINLSSDKLKLNSELSLKDKLVKIDSLNGKYLNSGFNIKGAVMLGDDGQDLDLYADLNLYPADLAGFMPASFAENIKKMKLDGVLKSKGSLVGKSNDYKGWAIALTNSCDTLSVYGLKINNLAFTIQQDKGALKIPFTASAYAGKLNADFNADLKPATPVYTLKLSAADIDLSKLKADTVLKDKEFSGILNLSADLRGDYRGPESMKGNGAVSVKDGNLWQMSLFKGLGELFLLPEYKNIVLKEASGDLMIADKYIYTENLRLASDQLKLDCRGRLGFDGTLDFLINNEINQAMITESPDIRKFSTVILGGLSQALTVKVEGTLQKPAYKVVPATKELIKNLKDLILGN